MNKKQVYEYAVLRIVPKVEREEFINVGIILYSKHLRFIATKISLNENKLLTLDPTIDLAIIHQYLAAFQTISDGNKKLIHTIASMDMADRFRWLTANRSTILQCSPLHTGLTEDAKLEIENLFIKYV